MPVLNDQAAASRAANRHVELEFANDVDTIMSSVGEKGILFTQAVPTGDGGFTFTVQTSRSDVRNYYETRNAAIEVLTSRPVVEVSSGWHTFMEGISTLRDRQTDEVVTQHFLALLVPQDGDGDLVGECPWPRHLAHRRDPVEAGSPDAVAVSRLALLTMHEDMVAAVEAGDAAAVGRAFHADAGLVSTPFPGDAGHTTAYGRTAVTDYYRSLFRLFPRIDVQCLTRICGEWYVYSDQLWALHDNAGTMTSMRLAEYLPVDSSGSVVARVCYGMMV